MEAAEVPVQRPRTRSLETLMVYIRLLREFHFTGHLPPPSSRIFRIPPDQVSKLFTGTSFPDFIDLADQVVDDEGFGDLRKQHPNTLAHHFCIALFGQAQLPAVCTFIQTLQAPYRYSDVPRVPTLPDIKVMARLRKALDAVVPLYMERVTMEMFPAWEEAYPGATGEPVFERGKDEAAVNNIERAFLRMWTIGQILSRSRVDMFRLRNRAMPHRYDQGNQDLFWEFMQRIPPEEVDILRGCTARLNMEESWLAYVLGEQQNVSVENPSQTRRVARNIRDLLFWSYDFGPDAVVLE